LRRLKENRHNERVTTATAKEIHMDRTIPVIVGQPHGRAVFREGLSRLMAPADHANFSSDRFSVHRKKSPRRDAAGRDHAQTLIEANERIRRHIARELHDDIGQRLALLSIKLDLFRQLQRIDDPNGNLAELRRDLDTVISDVHHLSHTMHSSGIEHLGLKAALQELLARLSEPCNMHFDFVARGVPEDLPSGFTLCFFRIAQESLNNAIKHSGASRMRIELSVDDGILTMSVRDFGSGFYRNHAQEGIGLATMEERIAAIGGTLTIESEPGFGTTVTATSELRSDAALVDS
jgi:signal transduction histidine kinase